MEILTDCFLRRLYHTSNLFPCIQVGSKHDVRKTLRAYFPVTSIKKVYMNISQKWHSKKFKGFKSED